MGTALGLGLEILHMAMQRLVVGIAPGTGFSRAPRRRGRAPAWAASVFSALALSALAVGILLAAVPCLQAQPLGPIPQPGGEEAGELDFDILPEAPRELRQKLAAAKRALESQQYSDAVDLLGELLNDGVAEDYFVRSPGSNSQRSLKSEALGLVGSMPAAGREAYELQFGTEGASLLDRAVGQGDITALTECSRRYFHTKAGYTATLLLGRYYLEQGQPLAGAMALERLSGSQAAAEFQPEMGLLLSACWLQAGQGERARQALVKCKAESGGAAIRLSGKEVAWFDNDAQAVSWFEGAIGVKAPSTQRFDRWTLHRGNPARNAEGAGEWPLLNFRWSVPTINDRKDELLVQRMRKQYQDQGLAALPSLFPLAVADTIVMRTPELVVGVDFQTGKRTWVYPFIGSPASSAPLASSAASRNNDPTQLRAASLRQRLFEDGPYGQLSSDGKSVFVINELSPNAAQNPWAMARFGRIVPSGETTASNNELVALSLRREGAQVWCVGGDSGKDEPKLKDAFFLGPPLPYEGQLYALCEMRGEILLVVLNAATGRLEWSQQVAQITDVRPPIAYDSQRRLAGASPSYADGVLICPTSAGAVVAVDVAARSLLWGFKYAPPQNTQNRVGVWQATMYGNRADDFGRRWHDATAIIAEGKVLVTPVEGDRLYCLDLITGAKLWEKERGELLYVGCAHGGVAAVVSKSHLHGFKLADGNELWPAVELGGLPTGRGFFHGPHYFVPTAASELVQVDLVSGKIARKVATKEPLGNIICYHDQIIAQGSEWLLSFHQAEPLRKQVESRLRQNPNDAWALARQGELQLHDGLREEAISSLRQSLAADPANESVRHLLAETMLLVLRQDFPRYAGLAKELEGLLDSPQQLGEFLRLQAAGFVKLGQRAAALESYLKLARLEASPEGDFQPRDLPLESIEANRVVRRDIWVQTQIGELFRSAGTNEIPALERLAQREFEAAAQAGTPSQWQEFLSRFAEHPLAHEARLQLAEIQIARDDFLAAEFLLDQVKGEIHAPRLTYARARLWERSGNVRAAAACYGELAGRFRDVPCYNGETGGQIFATLADQSPIKLALTQPHRWPAGEIQVAGEPPGRAMRSLSDRRLTLLPIRDRRGHFPSGATVTMDANRYGILARDGWGELLASISLAQESRSPFVSYSRSVAHASVNGHLLVASLGYELVAVDLSKREGQEVVLWRADLAPALPVEARSAGVAARPVRNPWLEQPRYVAADRSGRMLGRMGPVTSRGICYQRDRELICVDSLTGDVLWQRDNIPPGADIFGDDETLIVALSSGSNALALRLSDGARVGDVTIPEDARRWLTVGCQVLTWSEDGRGMQLRLENPLAKEQERAVWKRDFANGSKAWVIENAELAVLQPDGALVILDLATGAPRVQAKLDEESSLLGVYVIRSSDHYHVVVNRPVANQNPDLHYLAAPGGSACPLVNGKVYCFARRSGESVWPVPAIVEAYSLPLDQPAESPVLLFMRHTQPKQPRAREEGRRTQFLCLDKRDGRAVAGLEDTPGETTGYELTVHEDSETVKLHTPLRSVTLTFTSHPVPPEPPAQTGSASSLRTRSGTPGAAILKAFGKVFDAERENPNENIEDALPDDLFEDP